MSKINRSTLRRILNDLAAEIDVPPSKYQEAKDRYDAVGRWLGDEDSTLAPFNPTISPQGSFALGTAVRPRGNDDYDVDAVCLLQLTRHQVTQWQLKAMIGNRLKHPKSRYRNMIKPPDGGRRCWTIVYADSSKFHLDVLPAIPDDYRWLLNLGVPADWARTAILLTDRKTWTVDPTWPRSNPKGYVAWFKHQMVVSLQEAKVALASASFAEVEEIEDFRVRTPLQRLVQILKRDRDVRYNGDDDKPISIIITTLAAQAYNNEPDVLDALLNVIPAMRRGIETRNGTFWVPNPVNPEENFADKWAEEPRKAHLFTEWLNAIEREYQDLLTDNGIAGVGDYLTKRFGGRDAAVAMAKHLDRVKTSQRTSVVAPAVIVPRKTDRPPATQVSIPDRPSKPWRP